MKKIDKAMLYCMPLMCRLGSRPSILAFPAECENWNARVEGVDIPIFVLSMYATKYRRTNIGTSLI